MQILETSEKKLKGRKKKIQVIFSQENSILSTRSIIFKSFSSSNRLILRHRMRFESHSLSHCSFVQNFISFITEIILLSFARQINFLDFFFHYCVAENYFTNLIFYGFIILNFLISSFSLNTYLNLH